MLYDATTYQMKFGLCWNLICLVRQANGVESLEITVCLLMRYSGFCVPAPHGVIYRQSMVNGVRSISALTVGAQMAPGKKYWNC